MRTMVDLGVTGLLELPPAGTLAGLAKRGIPGVETVALKSPDDLEAARDLVGGTAAPTRSATPPPGGCSSLRPRGRSGGPSRRCSCSPGQAVGVVITLRDQQEVLAPHGGHVVEWLVEDGDPVAPGQPLVRLHPEAVLA